jgi:hypothetical protein
MEDSKVKSQSQEVISEQNVVILGCVNKDLIEKINKLVEEENGGKVILTSDDAVYDYVESQGQPTSRSKKSDDERLKDFLYNEKNRKYAETQALMLWNILTKKAPVEQAEVRVLSKSLIPKLTTLKEWKDINALLDFLKAFGYLQFTKDNATYEFKILFNKDMRKNAAKAEIIEACANVSDAILVYKEVLKADFGYNKEQLENESADIKTEVNSMVKF